MRVLIYKRTHNGDPDETGCFGAEDCMGTVRDREFDAVIGVGGIGAEARANGIAGQINWVGIGPHKSYIRGKRGPEVTFDHFLDFGTDGPDLRTFAPALADRMYGGKVRSMLHSLSAKERAEAAKIIRLAEGEPLSTGGRSARRVRTCGQCMPKGRTRRCT
jgi:hypothetical protein